MREFLDQLFTTGQVTVPPAGVSFDDDEIELEIRQFDRSARLSLSGEAPELDIESAVWAAGMLAEAARLAIARELSPAEIGQIITRGCPKPRSPEVDYSADLFLRYLPELLAWVQRLAGDDPLLEHLRRLGAEWPLSSVGIKGLAVGSIEPFVGHASLRRLYVDRILAADDVSRLSDPRVADAARAAVGAHPELAPAVAKTLEPVAAAEV
jgi:hypothetical protein